MLWKSFLCHCARRIFVSLIVSLSPPFALGCFPLGKLRSLTQRPPSLHPARINHRLAIRINLRSQFSRGAHEPTYTYVTVFSFVRHFREATLSQTPPSGIPARSFSPTTRRGRKALITESLISLDLIGTSSLSRCILYRFLSKESHTHLPTHQGQQMSGSSGSRQKKNFHRTGDDAPGPPFDADFTI